MVPLTLPLHSNPVWELLLHELLDINGDWKTQVAFWYAFPDRSSLFLFITIFSLSFFSPLIQYSKPSPFLSTFLSPFPVIPTATSMWAMQLDSPSTHLVCSAAENYLHQHPTFPVMYTHTHIYTHTRSYLLEIIFKKENKYQVMNESLPHLRFSEIILIQYYIVHL